MKLVAIIKKYLAFRWYVFIPVLIGFCSCTFKDKPDEQVKRYKFPEGEVSHFTLKNKNGVEVKIINYGATVTHVRVPDRLGNLCDVVLGFDSVRNYLSSPNPYFGCVVGRYANRIAKAQFVLNGDTIRLAKNNGENSIHGGIEGFNHKIWDIISFTDSSLTLFYLSKHGEEGFPGNLKTRVTYTLSSVDELIIDYWATTDKPTPVNLTNHSYFNLSGGRDSTILNHELYLNADQYTEVNEVLIPTGNIMNVRYGAMDFTLSKRIGRDVSQVENGYDHNWIVNKQKEKLSLAAVLYDPVSGRKMEVRTTQPGIQFYSGNFLNESIVGKKGVRYQKYSGLCLETQYYPDSPNHPEFPSTILYPNEKYRETTIYRFFAE